MKKKTCTCYSNLAQLKPTSKADATFGNKKHIN